MNRCIFCNPSKETILYNDDVCRVILVDDKYYLGYIQVISNIHAKELTDLPQENVLAIFNLLLKIETKIRKLFNPDKINIACFGNMVPHVHFHIIPRYKNDRHFPNPIWGDVTNPTYLPSEELQNHNNQLVKLPF